MKDFINSVHLLFVYHKNRIKFVHCNRGCLFAFLIYQSRCPLVDGHLLLIAIGEDF